MKTIPIGTLFKIKAWHPATYYHLPRTKIMIAGTVHAGITRISDGIMEIDIKDGEKSQMIKTSGVEVLEKDLIRMYFEAT